MDSDGLLHFCDITGANPDLADKYLMVSEYDVERAVAFYFENGGAELSSAPVAEALIAPHSLSNDSDIESDFMIEEDVVRDLPSPINRPPEPFIDSRMGYDAEEDAPQPSIHNQFDMLSSSENNNDNPFVRVERQMFELSFRGSFESAREAAKRASKLLLVTVHDDTEFSCFATNRDLFTKPERTAIKEFVKENLILLYIRKKTAEAERHLTFYPISNLPYIGIIDPLTGERIKIWQHAPPEMEFMQDVYDLIEKHQKMGLLLSPQIEDFTSEDVPTLSNQASIVAATEAEKLNLILPINHPEPEIGNITRIQFRKPDGTRLIRKFLKESKVIMIFEYLRSTIDQSFELRSCREDLMDKIDQSIEEAGLVNSTVNIEYS